MITVIITKLNESNNNGA